MAGDDFAERMAQLTPPPGMTSDDLRNLGQLVNDRIDEARTADPGAWPDWLTP